jgi:cytidylate kinase
LPQAVIVKPLAAARDIKADGADIVEALQVLSAAELEQYIKKAKPVALKTEEPKKPPPADASGLPFRILGTSDDNRANFIGLHERQISPPLTKITKSDLFALASLDVWSELFGHKGRIQWEDALAWITGLVTATDFDPAMLRGRGAWAENDGRICYHNGRKTIGDVDDRRIYMRKTPRDIGIEDAPASDEICLEVSSAIGRMSFETWADCVRLQGWIVLAPFAGALPWRPCGMITGSSGSGKSTVIDLCVKPLALPEIFSGGDSTEAGVRQRIRNDAAAIVIEESETDTDKKKRNRENLFSLMRQSTSDQAPRVAKGTMDGKGQSYSMRSMFLFASISSEVEHTADENRIFRINMVDPTSPWPPIRDRLIELIIDKHCRAIRARTWQNLKTIIKFAHDLTPIVQGITGRSSRFALAESMLFAGFFLVMRARPAEITEQIQKEITALYEYQPPEATRDDSAELVELILDSKVMIDIPRKELTSFREILTGCYTSQMPGFPKLLNSTEVLALNAVAARHGLKIDETGQVMIAFNHPEIMKMIDKGHGYHRMLQRHKGLVKKSKPASFLNKSRRAVVIEGLIEGDHSEPAREDEEY